MTSQPFTCQLKKTLHCMEKTYNDVLKLHDITLTQGQALMYIFNYPKCTQTELALSASKDKTTITRLIDTLVNKNFVLRVGDTNDRRVFCLELTDKGKQSISTIKAVFKKQEEVLKSLFEQNEYQSIIKTLQTIEHKFA